MDEGHPHPLLSQIPLTVSPHLHLPSGTQLPHTYVPLPSLLPPSITDPSPSSNNTEEPSRATYVVSQSGASAHPDDLIASCRALQSHLARMQADSNRTLDEWRRGREEAELAERRRVAPGWLDVGEGGRGVMVPERRGGSSVVSNEAGEGAARSEQIEKGLADLLLVDGGEPEGEELDRAFGGMNIQR